MEGLFSKDDKRRRYARTIQRLDTESSEGDAVHEHILHGIRDEQKGYGSSIARMKDSDTEVKDEVIP